MFSVSVLHDWAIETTLCWGCEYVVVRVWTPEPEERKDFFTDLPERSCGVVCDA